MVQGVGFRPWVYARAAELGLTGWVGNTAEGVRLEVEGSGGAVAAFADRLARDAPPLARVDHVAWEDVTPTGGTGFTIEASGGGPGRTLVSPDVAMCADCERELTDPRDRRHRHPFVTCTNCGPRFTIVTGLPYDRDTCTMAGFPMCPACAAEYADPADRRFHAQTVCCPDCGPVLTLTRPGAPPETGDAALDAARRLVADGGVVAVKGLGGFHLACDATDEQAVALLRKRKQRGDKPFAVLVPDVTAARGLAHLDAAEAALLTGHHRPIVLLRRRAGSPLAPSVAPGLDDVGLMVAYTPLHRLLLGLPGDRPGPGALVLTSGNLAGEPIVTDDAEARERLAGLADAWLGHDRPIHVPCDDSVARVVDGVELPLRRSRGYAPLPVDLPFDAPAALAVGGDVKNTFCLAEGRQAWLSAHVGDMDDLATQRAFGDAERHLETITGVRPTALAADAHPGYRSGRWAREHAAGRPVRLVQHHHAHVTSTMAEHGHDGRSRVIGVAFDGTGYGDDGAAWGGEFLLADYAGFDRAAHLGAVPLPGGDAGVRNPCRMALSHLRAAGVAWDAGLPSVRACAPEELRLLETQLERGLACVATTSMGRLFDAVASVAGVCQRIGYEAQAAVELEAVTRRAEADGSYAFALQEGPGPLRLDPGPVVSAAARDALAGEPAGVIGLRFHRAVVDGVAAVASRLRRRTGLEVVTLSGGVFANVLLTSWCAAALERDGFRVLRHRRVPPTDAGLALGQVAVLAHRATEAPRSKAPEQEPEQAGRPPRKEQPCA